MGISLSFHKLQWIIKEWHLRRYNSKMTHPSVLLMKCLSLWKKFVMMFNILIKVPAYTLKQFYFRDNYLNNMSLHWTIIAGFLYGEIAATLLLLIPFISPRAWNKLFKSRLLKGLENQLIYYFYVLVTILVLFFLGKFLWQKLLHLI